MWRRAPSIDRGGEATRVPRDARWGNIVAGMCAIAIGWFVFRAAVEVTVSPRSVWNERSLAPAFVVARGGALYPPREGGPLLSCIYAPLSAVAYVPATLARDPSSAMRIGVVISVLFFLAPLGLALWLRLWSWVGASLYLGLAVGSAGVSYSIFPIHADAPALGFAGLGAICLSGRLGLGWRVAGGAMLVLAALSKQNMAPLAMLGPLLVGWREGWRRAAASLAGGCAAGLAVLTYSLVVLGRLEDLYFNLVTVPVGAGFAQTGFFAAARALGADMIPSLCVLALCLALYWRGRGRSDGGWRWGDAGLALALSVALWPTSVAGYMKLGGYPNALAPGVYLAILGACFVADRAAGFSRWAGIGLAGFALMAGAFTAPVVAWSLREWRGTEATWTQRAFEFERRHPGEVYFPANPLAPLMVSGRLYHMDDGLYCRAVAGYPVTEEQFMRHLPEGASRIAFIPGGRELLLRSTGDVLRERLAPEPSDDLRAWEMHRFSRGPAGGSDHGR